MGKMEGFDWKTFAAAWGGILATINSIYLMSAKRPVFVVGPKPDRNSLPASVYLNIHNPSSYPVQITRLWKWGKNPTVGVFPVLTGLTVRQSANEAASWIETCQTNRFHQYVAPNSSTTLGINTIKKDTSEFLIFLYHRHRFLLPPAVKIIRITGETAKQIDRGDEDYWGE